MLRVASLTSSWHDFAKAISDFFDHLAAVNWIWLSAGLLAITGYLTIRCIASRNVLRATFPDSRVPFIRIWGAYIAGFGFNGVVPAHAGSVIRLFLTKTSINKSSYPAVASSFAVESIFDWIIVIPVMAYAFSQGVFPKPPDFAKISAFDLSYFASHFRLTLFLITVAAILIILGFAFLSSHVRAFWLRIRQGFTILRDRPRYLREVFVIQLGAWVCRCGAFWCFLDAFHIGGSIRNVLLVMGVSAVSSVVPFTPGGAGVQQALLLAVFAHTASSATVAAYSVGQQVAIAAWGFLIGFLCVVFIFRFRSFKEVVQKGKAAREADAAAREAGASGPTSGDSS